MAQFTGTPRIFPEPVRDHFTQEVAGDLGLLDKIAARGWPEMTSRDCGRVGGRIGGSMVKVMIRHAAEYLAETAREP